MSHSLSSEEHVFFLLERTREDFLTSQGEGAHIFSNIQEEL